MARESAGGLRHDAEIERVRRAAVNAPGVVDHSARRGAYEAFPLQGPLGSYLEKVSNAAWSITDDDIAVRGPRAIPRTRSSSSPSPPRPAPRAVATTRRCTRCAARRDVRLTVLESGHRLRARLFLAFARRVAGGAEVDDVFKTILYRPELFGGPAWSGLLRSSLRGRSEWSAGERELFAAATSQANRCGFCADIHSCIATLTLGQEVTPQLIDEREADVFRPQVAAMLELIDEVTREPERVTSESVDEVRAAGVSDEAIADGLAILFAFNWNLLAGRVRLLLEQRDTPDPGSRDAGPIRIDSRPGSSCAERVALARSGPRPSGSSCTPASVGSVLV